MPPRDEYARLENRLVLLAWLNSLFGYEKNLDLLRDLKTVDEKSNSEGRSGVVRQLLSRSDRLKLDPDALAGYDANIQRHLAAMNERRTDKIRLRYFQHLATLYTEVFLDRYFNQRPALLRDLNVFIAGRNSTKGPGEPADPTFTEPDLTKLAYWMATGSGKTLIMHLNYRQFLHYNSEALDNILLITPNEGLSEQHMREMRMSGIRCERFSPEESGLGLSGRDTVRVIEITKLVEEKKGGGVTVPVEAFEGNNLIFVDEGHKGTHGKVWRGYRDKLAETGFTFEYSATFGQALHASGSDDLTAEYGKAIIFDYSYKYFYGDGFGKDFHVLNLREETTEDQADVLLLANLLSFYEQVRLFADRGPALRPYGIDPPLWVFVGSSVNVVYTEARQKRSDVLTVARFLHRFLRNEGTWAVRTIQQILDGQSGLKDTNDRDVFAERFPYLRASGTDAATLYQQMLHGVFNAPASGGLLLKDIKGSDGELGLMVAGAEDYFGLIFIGDTTAFRKLVEEDNAGIELGEENIAGSLFDRLRSADSSLSVLIGAKKFIEGWDTWRVSNMGLLNIGRGEGSQIVQLFGRGVRLRGRELSLKRSKELPGSHPPNIGLLETLNIFAIRADYMGSFREYLEKEGVDIDGRVELPVKLRQNETFLDSGLLVPKPPAGRNFAAEVGYLLEPVEAAVARVDVSTRVQTVVGGGELAGVSASAGEEQAVASNVLDMLDWEDIYLGLQEYKRQKGYTGLVLRHKDLRPILENDPRLYRLTADPEVFAPSSFTGMRTRTRSAVLSVLKKYTDRLATVQRRRWESGNLEYQVLARDDANFKDYTISVSKSERELVESVADLIADSDRLYDLEAGVLARIHFDRHLYQPLLVERGEQVQVTPPALKKSERRFVADLKAYFGEHSGDTLADTELFLLRNLSKGRGIGFFTDEGFYPDFILWLKTTAGQRIIFIEPHGMIHEKRYDFDGRARLHEDLPRLSRTMSGRSHLSGVTLDSFIVSSTKYEDLRQRYEAWSRAEYASKHILFQEPRTAEYDYIGKILAS